MKSFNTFTGFGGGGWVATLRKLVEHSVRREEGEGKETRQRPKLSFTRESKTRRNRANPKDLQGKIYLSQVYPGTGHDTQLYECAQHKLAKIETLTCT